MNDLDEKKTCLGKVEEEQIVYQNDEEMASLQCPSTDNSFISSGPDVAVCRRIDASSALEVSDSELLCQKQRKPHALDALLALGDGDSIDENVVGNVLPATTTTLLCTPARADTTPVPPSSVRSPQMDATILHTVQSFPLPVGQRNPPVAGPPLLDQDMLQRMEQLHIPVSLPREDVERVARLEQLKQLSCRE